MPLCLHAFVPPCLCAFVTQCFCASEESRVSGGSSSYLLCEVVAVVAVLDLCLE